MKLQHRLLLLYVISTIFILLVVGAVFYNRIWADRLETIRKDMMNELQHVEFALNGFFVDVENDVLTLAADETVRSRNDGDFTNFLHADERSFRYRIGETEQQIISIFKNYLQTHAYVNSVYMGRENGGFVRSHKRERPTRYDPRTRPWYVLGKSNPGAVMKTDAYPSLTTSDVNIGFVKALVDKQGVFFGVVGVDVTLVKLTDYIANIQINPAGRIILVDGKGVVLAGLGKDLLFKDVHTHSAELATALKETGEAPREVNIRDEKFYVFSRKFARQGWTIAALIPAENIEKEIMDQIFVMISGLVIGLLLLSSFTLIGLKMYVVRPLQRFIAETDHIARTADLERRIDIDTRDEIGLLATSYNQMLQNLRATYQALKDTERDLIQHRDHLEELMRERTASLEEANESLAMEIGERVSALRELAAAKERAEAADRLKSSFLATMSHELRTPLNSIIGFTGIILQGIVGPLNEEQRKQLEMVRNSAQHLLSLINDVLDISKIEAGQLQLTPENFDLRQSLEKVVESARPLAERKGLDLFWSLAPGILEVYADRRRVEQVLINLISNAVKFTERGSIAVVCEASGDRLIFRVRDTGIGIKEEDIPKIFQAFRQIDTGLSRKYEGTGLGLSICRRLVELMGGEISVTSVWGSGSTFSFTLPLSLRT